MSDINATPRAPRNIHSPTIGIIGGGQLAKMLGQAASQLGVQVIVLTDNPQCPAAATCHRIITESSNSLASLRELASQVDVVTLENEFVDAALLRQLEEEGHCVRPTSRSIELVQDKLIQKDVLRAAGLPVPAFVDIPTRESLDIAIAQLGLPLVLKKRRNGYDGKGNATLRKIEDAQKVWDELSGNQHALFAEGFVDFTHELAVMISRTPEGASAIYPVVETIQKDHICHVVKAPAQIPIDVKTRAVTLAKQAVEAMQGVGSFGIEMFYSRSGEVLINELAPRVHNSGHYTIEACECSQFENHIRTILGWPLGSPTLNAPAAVMINLLGMNNGHGYPMGIGQALQIDGAHIHVYGKSLSAPSRKMGHVTAMGASLDIAFELAQNAAKLIRFGDSKI